MQNDIFVSLRNLSDAELVARLKCLAARERDAMAQLVAHLAEFDTRDVHLRAGYGSLFAYCREVLALSEHETYNRIEVARAARRFPVILEMLAEGSVCLTSVRLLAPHLTPDNYGSLLEHARGKKKVEVQEIVATLSPRPDVSHSVRKLPAPTPTLTTPAGSCDVAAPVVPALPKPPMQPRSAELMPLSLNRYKVQFTIGGDTLEKLRLAKDMLRHAIPSGDEATILDRALTALLADLARKKFAGAEKNRPSRGTGAGTRNIPADVKRAVWLRDLGRCAFVGTNDHRCNERGFLEFHHVRPYAMGGEATVENVQLRCRRHNDYEARVYFGRDRPDSFDGFVREGAATYNSGRSTCDRLVPERVVIEAHPTERVATTCRWRTASW